MRWGGSLLAACAALWQLSRARAAADLAPVTIQGEAGLAELRQGQAWLAAAVFAAAAPLLLFAFRPRAGRAETLEPALTLRLCSRIQQALASRPRLAVFGGWTSLVAVSVAALCAAGALRSVRPYPPTAWHGGAQHGVVIGYFACLFSSIAAVVQGTLRWPAGGPSGPDIGPGWGRGVLGAAQALLMFAIGVNVWLLLAVIMSGTGVAGR